MPIIKNHIKDLYYKIGYYVISISSMLLCCFLKQDVILYYIISLLEKDLYIRKFLMLDNFLYISAIDLFSIVMFTLIYLSVIGTSIIFIYYIFSFLIPGMYSKDCKYYLKLLLLFSILFSISFILSNWYLYPKLYSFLIYLSYISGMQFDNQYNISFEVHISDIINIYLKSGIITIMFGQLPIIIFICYIFNIITSNFLITYRKLIIYSIFSLIVIIIPMDLIVCILLILFIFTFHELVLYIIIIQDNLKKLRS